MVVQIITRQFFKKSLSVFLTSKDEEVDELLGLKLGADELIQVILEEQMVGFSKLVKFQDYFPDAQ